METATLQESAGPPPQIQYIEVVTADYDKSDTQGHTYMDLASVDTAESYTSFCTSETCTVQPDSAGKVNLDSDGRLNVGVIDRTSSLPAVTMQEAEAVSSAENIENVHPDPFSAPQAQDHLDPTVYVKQVVINGQQQTVLVDCNNRQVATLSSGDTLSHPDVPLPASPVSICNINDSEEPLYVNAKQYHRILKRREARAKLEARHKIYKARSKFLYNSRHSHAAKRPRGPGGKFLKQPPQEPTATSPGHM